MIKIYKKHHQSRFYPLPSIRQLADHRLLSIIYRQIIRRKLLIVSIVVLLITLPILYLTFKYQNKIEAAWMNNNWLYRTTLTFGNTGAATTDKKVKFDIDTATLYSAGKIQSDCGDSRFTDINGKELKYYIDTANGACNTNSTDYYVLVPTINTGNTVLYHYYGNPSAANGTQASQFSQSTFSPTSGPSTGSEEKSPGPVAYWKFDEGVGTTANDSIDNKYGTITGAVWQQEDMCVSGKCLYFDGSSDNVSISGSINISTRFTISHWLRTASTGSQVYTVGNAGGSNGYRFGISSGKVAFLVGNGTGYTETTCGTKTVNDNKWHLITGVYDSSNNFTCYIDGKYEAAVNIGDFTGISTSAPGIGAPPCCTDFQGYIDDVKIYDYARTAGEVKSDFNSRGSGSTKGLSALLGTNKDNLDALSNGLIGYWKMDETSWNGTSGEAKDASGNENNGTSVNGATTTQGKFGYGGSFDGTNDYVNVSDNDLFSFSADFSISLWVKLDQLSSTKGESQTILQKKNSSGTPKWTEYAIYTYYTGSENRFLFQWYNSDGTTFSTDTDGIADNLQTNTWYQITAIKSGDKIKIFANAVNNSSNDAKVSGSYWNSDSYLRFGADEAGSLRLDGVMDEVRLYNRALSPVEIRQLYSFAPGPVGYWKMDEGSWNGTSGEVKDTSGNGNNGTATSGPTTSAGKYGKSGIFNGSSNQYVTVADPGATSLDITGGLTISAWIYKTGNTSSGGWADLITKATTNAATANYWFQIVDISNSEYINFYMVGGASGEMRSTTPISLNTWQHVAVTYDDAANDVIFYVNGIKTGDTLVWGTSPESQSLVTNNEPLRIGYTYSGQAFTGKIDDVRVYNYARTSGQIVEDMNAGHPIVGSPVGSALAHYKFDEGTGLTAFNSGSIGSTINADLGSNPSTPTWSNDGKFGKALKFDGSDDYVQINDPGTNSALDIDSQWTISTWIKTSGSNWDFILSKGVYPNYNYKINMGASSTTVQVCTGISGTQRCVESTGIIPLNTWTHIVGTFNGTNITVYLNGNFNNTASYSGTSNTNNSHVRIGNYGSESGYEFNGLIDEVKIYNTALTEDQVKQDYNQSKTIVLGYAGTDASGVASNSAAISYCPPGNAEGNCAAGLNPAPVAEWKMDEKTGTYAYDTSGNNLSAQLGGGTSSYYPTWTAGKYGGGLNFDGSNDYLSVSNNDLLKPSGDITLQAWIKLDQLSTTKGESQYILIKKHNASPWQSYSLAVRSTDNTLHFSWVNTSSTFYQEISSTALSANTWYHVAAVKEGTKIYLYINGKKEPAVWNPTTTGTIYNSNDSLRIGADWYGGSRTDGIIDHAVIYPYARSQAQIAWDYNRGKPVGWWKMDECQGNSIYNSSNSIYGSTAADITDSPSTVINHGYNNYEYVKVSDSNYASPENCANTIYVQVIKNGSYTPGSESTTLNSTESYYYFGGPTALWGETFTPSDINASNFGVHFVDSSSQAMYVYFDFNIDSRYQIVGIKIGVQAKLVYDNGPGCDVPWINHIQMTIYYSKNSGTWYGTESGVTSVGTCTTSGTAWYNGATGKFNSSLSFDGSDDYVDLGSTQIIGGSTITDDFTISGWTNTSVDGNPIFSQGNTSDSDVLFELITGGANNGVTLNVRNTSGTLYQVNEGAGSPDRTDGNWHHFTAVRKSSTVYLYYDGTMVKSGSFSPSGTYSINRAYIGRRVNGSLYFNGKIDDVRVFNYGLSAVQVKNLYNEGSAVRFGPNTGSP